MHWKKRQKQIQYLQAKHGNDRSLAREFPDLKVEQRTAPCSNGMRGSTARRVLPPGMKQFPVGHCHKQGLELIIPGADLQWTGARSHESDLTVGTMASLRATEITANVAVAAAGMLFNSMIGSSGLGSAFGRNCSDDAGLRLVSGGLDLSNYPAGRCAIFARVSGSEMAKMRASPLAFTCAALLRRARVSS